MRFGKAAVEDGSPLPPPSSGLQSPWQRRFMGVGASAGGGRPLPLDASVGRVPDAPFLKITDRAPNTEFVDVSGESFRVVIFATVLVITLLFLSPLWYLPLPPPPPLD